jgi:hypothetical protein
MDSESETMAEQVIGILIVVTLQPETTNPQIENKQLPASLEKRARTVPQ